MAPNDILEYFQDRHDAIIETIGEIVGIESPSHNVTQSLMVVEKIAGLARDLPLDVKIDRIPAENCGEHLLIRAFPDDRQPPFLLLGHTDTVHPVGTNLKNPTRIEGDKYYGCGIFDMKANIALILEVLRFLGERGMRPRAPINILLSCDEEVGSATGRPIVERESAGAAVCLVLEPSAEGKVKTGRKGTGIFQLKAHGIPAHAGLEPEKGASAILELARQIERIHDLSDIKLGTTVNVCTIRGGTTSNVIPEYAECEIDVRFSAAAESRRIETALFSLSPIDGKVTLQMNGGINRPPLERTPAVVELYSRAKELASSFGYDLGETQVGGASDGNFVGAMGIPILDGLGIAGAGAHTLNEHILISDIPKRATLATLLLTDGPKAT